MPRVSSSRRYEVSALAPGEVVFKGIVEIVPGQANEFVIALDESQAMFDDADGFVEPAVAVCTDQPSGCPFSDPDTGLSLIIPDGWSMTQPFVYQTAAGVSASVASATLFRGRDGGVVELNPRQWTSMLGDCVDAGAHRICYGDTVDADLRVALAVLQRSLGQVDP